MTPAPDAYAVFCGLDVGKSDLDPPAGTVVLSFNEKTQVQRSIARSRCCRSTSG